MHEIIHPMFHSNLVNFKILTRLEWNMEWNLDEIWMKFRMKSAQSFEWEKMKKFGQTKFEWNMDEIWMKFNLCGHSNVQPSQFNCSLTTF